MKSNQSTAIVSTLIDGFINETPIVEGNEDNTSIYLSNACDYHRLISHCQSHIALRVQTFMSILPTDVWTIILGLVCQDYISLGGGAGSGGSSDDDSSDWDPDLRHIDSAIGEIYKLHSVNKLWYRIMFDNVRLRMKRYLGRPISNRFIRHSINELVTLNLSRKESYISSSVIEECINLTSLEFDYSYKPISVGLLTNLVTLLISSSKRVIGLTQLDKLVNLRKLELTDIIVSDTSLNFMTLLDELSLTYTYNCTCWGLLDLSKTTTTTTGLNLPKLTSLLIKGSFFVQIDSLPNLRYLTLVDTIHSSFPSQLTRLSRLTILSVESTDIDRHQPLFYRKIAITDDIINSLQSLIYLQLDHDTDITSNGLMGLRHLVFVSIRWNHGITEIPYGVKVLNVDKKARIFKLPLSLESLRIEDNEGSLTNGVIRPLSNLKILSITNSSTIGFEAFHQLTNLKVLSIDQSCKTKANSLNGTLILLQPLTNLTMLNITNNNLIYGSHLDDLPKLRVLDRINCLSFYDFTPTMSRYESRAIDWDQVTKELVETNRRIQ